MRIHPSQYQYFRNKDLRGLGLSPREIQVLRNARLNRELLVNLQKTLDAEAQAALTKIAAEFDFVPMVMTFDTVVGAQGSLPNGEKSPRGIKEDFLDFKHKITKVFGVGDDKFDDCGVASTLSCVGSENAKVLIQAMFGAMYGYNIALICQMRDRDNTNVARQNRVTNISILELAAGYRTIVGAKGFNIPLGQDFVRVLKSIASALVGAAWFSIADLINYQSSDTPIAAEFVQMTERLAAWTILKYPELFPTGVFGSFDDAAATTRRYNFAKMCAAMTDKENSLEPWVWYATAPAYGAYALNKYLAMGMTYSSFSYLDNCGNKRSSADGFTVTSFHAMIGDMLSTSLGKRILGNLNTAADFLTDTNKFIGSFKHTLAEKDKIKQDGKSEGAPAESASSGATSGGYRLRGLGQSPGCSTTPSPVVDEVTGLDKLVTAATLIGTGVSVVDTATKIGGAFGWQGAAVYLTAAVGGVTLYTAAATTYQMGRKEPEIQLGGDGYFDNYKDESQAVGLNIVGHSGVNYPTLNKMTEGLPVEMARAHKALAEFVAMQANSVMAWKNGYKNEMKESIEAELNEADAADADAGLSVADSEGVRSLLREFDYAPDIFRPMMMFVPQNYRFYDNKNKSFIGWEGSAQAGGDGDPCVFNSQCKCNGTCTNYRCIPGTCEDGSSTDEGSNAWLIALAGLAAVGAAFYIYKKRKQNKGA